MLSSRSCSYAIYFICLFQAVLSTTLPWAKLNVEKAGNTRVVYSRASQASADTAEGLIHLVDAETLADTFKDVTNRNEVEFLFVNVGYFATGAASAPAPVSTGKKGKKKSAALPVLSALDTLSSDQVNSQLLSLYEDYTAAHFVKNLPEFIGLYCQRLYGQNIQSHKLESPYFDQIKAFKLSFSFGKVTIYSYLILNETDDPDFINRMHFGSQLSSLFPSSVPALLEQSAAGWQVIIDTLKSSASGSDITSLLSASSVPSQSTNSGKKGKGKNPKASAATTATATPPVNQISKEEKAAELLADIEKEEMEKKMAKERKLKQKEEQRLKQEEDLKNAQMEKEKKLKSEAVQREAQRKLQSERDIMAHKQKLEEQKLETQRKVDELNEKKRAEEERIDNERIAEQERIENERKAEQERIIENKRIAEQKRIERQRAAEQERIENERIAEQERIENERIAEQERIENERKAEQERIIENKRIAEQERIIENKRIAEQKRIEKQRAAEQKRIEKQRAAEQERIESERKAEQERITENERKAEQERVENERKAEQERVENERKAERKQAEKERKCLAAAKKQEEKEEAENIRIAALKRQQGEESQAFKRKNKAKALALALEEERLKSQKANSENEELRRELDLLRSQAQNSSHSPIVSTGSSVQSLNSPTNYPTSPAYSVGSQSGSAPIHDPSVYSGSLTAPQSAQHYPHQHYNPQYPPQQHQFDPHHQYSQQQYYRHPHPIPHPIPHHYPHPNPHHYPQHQPLPQYNPNIQHDLGYDRLLASHTAPLTVDTGSVPFNPIIGPRSTNSQSSRSSPKAQSFCDDVIVPQYSSPVSDLAGIFGTPSMKPDSPLSELNLTSSISFLGPSASNGGASMFGAIGSGRTNGESKNEDEKDHDGENFLDFFGKNLKF